MKRYALLIAPILAVAIVASLGIAFFRNTENRTSPESTGPIEARVASKLPTLQDTIQETQKVPDVRTAQTRSERDQEALSIAQRDIAGALRYIRGNFPPDDQQRAMGLLMRELCTKDLKAMAQIAPEIVSPVENQVAVGWIANIWARDNPGQASAMAERDLKGSLRAEFLEKLVSSFALNQKYEEATEALQKMPFGASRSSAIRSLAIGLSRTNPQEAIAWASKFPVQEDANAASSMLIMNFMQKRDADSLKLLAETTSSDNTRAFALRELGRISAETGGASQALADAAQSGSGNRDAMIAGAISGAPPGDLPRLGNEISTMKDRIAKGQALGEYIGRLVALDEKQAVAWVLSRPPDLKADALRNLVNRWYDTDSLAMSDWISTLPLGGDRDIALNQMAQRVRNSDQAAAAEVASQISDPSMRKQLQKALGIPQR